MSRESRRLLWFFFIAVTIGLCAARKQIVLQAIADYQQHVSPIKGYRCAFAQLHGGPSCSEYGRLMVERYGVARGIGLLHRRFADCARAADLLAARRSAPFAGRQLHGGGATGEAL